MPLLATIGMWSSRAVKFLGLFQIGQMVGDNIKDESELVGPWQGPHANPFGDTKVKALIGALTLGVGYFAFKSFKK